VRARWFPPPWLDAPFIARPLLALEVHHPRLGPEVFHQAEPARVLEFSRDLAVRVGEVSEEERTGGTRLGARRDDVAVADLPPFLGRGLLRPPDPLDAEGALFHDAA
jgi:hypothetical protein